MNEETHYFLTKGRITIQAFLLRLLFAVAMVVLCFVIYYKYALPKKYEKVKFINKEEVIYDTTFKSTFYAFEIFTFYILPSIMLSFVLVQAVKRIHDTNNSGWLVLAPLYNLVLLFSKGTDGNNDYGVNPRKQKQVKYFDELEKKK